MLSPAMRIKQKLAARGRVNLLDALGAAERFEHNGRGAISNQTGRFEPERRFAYDDGWDTIEEPAPRLDTILLDDHAKTIITFNSSPDISFDRSINPYLAVSTAAFIALRGRHMPGAGCLQVLISRAVCSGKRMLRIS